MNTNRFTRFTLVLTIVALIVGVSACDQVQQVLFPQPPDEPHPPEPSPMIPIGVAVALTGQYAVPLGLPMLDGFELAREEINNSGVLGDAKLTFIVEDTQSTSAVEAVNKLIDEDGVSMMTGFAISTQLAQVIPIVQEKGVVLFSSASSAPGLSALGDFIFRAGLTSAVLNPAVVKTTHDQFGYQKAGTIYQDGDTYSTLSDEVFRAALVETGVEVVAVEHYQDGDTDFTAQLTRIMAGEPEALFISGISDELPPIMIQARQLMPDVHFIVPELTNHEVEVAGAAAEGTATSIGWLAAIDTPMNQAFVQKYTEAYGVEPNTWAAQSYATLHILAAAIAQAGSTEAAAVKETLAAVDIETVLGQFSFNADGDAVYDPQILIVKDGVLQPFE